MFNIFKRKKTNNEKPISLSYDSYEIFNLVVEKIKPFIPDNFKDTINFEIMNYDRLIQYDGLFDSPCMNNDLINTDTTETELDKLADSIIDYWKDDDSAECLCESIINSCTKMNLYNVKLSFSFTNSTEHFKVSALIINWKLY